MNKKFIISLSKILLCAIFTICAMTNISQAASNGFTVLVNSPSITIEKPSTKKLEAIKVTIKAPTSATINTVTFYNGEKEDANNVFKPSLTSSKKSENLYTEMEYKIETKFLPAKNKSKTIIIYTKASNMESTRKIIKITNKDGKYYAINNAPSISDINYVEKDSKIALRVKSTGDNVKKIEIKDYNANNKVIYSNSSINKKTATINLDRSKVSLKNDSYYRITVYAYDKNGAYTVKDIAFKLPELKVENVDNQPVIDKVVCEHKNVKYTTTSTQHTKICKDCGEVLGKEYHIFGGQSSGEVYFVNIATGKCKVCGYVCKHTDISYHYNKYGHYKYCNTCGKMWNKENHNVQNGQCTICKISDKTIETMYYQDDYDNYEEMSHLSPRITTSKINSKLDDVKILIRTYGLSTTVRIYETDAQGNNKKELKIVKSKESTSEELIYVLSHKNLLKGEKHHFYITAKNKYGTTTHYITIAKNSKIENGKKIEYYAINGSPRMWCDDYPITLSNYGIFIQDNSGLKSVTITDMNNNNKQVFSYTAKTTMTTSKFITLNLEKKCKAQNGVYKLKLEMKDKSDSKKVSTRILVIDTKTSGWHKATGLCE